MKPEEVPETSIEQIDTDGKTEEQNIQQMKEQVREFNKQLNELEKEKKEVNFDVDGDFICVVGVSDLHYGNQNVNMDFVERIIGFIEQHERAYCFLNGDIIDNWVKLSPNGGRFEQTLKPEYQLKIMKEELEPISDKILGIVYGNHENRSVRQGEKNPMKQMAEDFDLPYLGAGGRINMNFNENIYKLHVRHRFRYESSFNPCHSCGRLIEQLDSDADIVAIGHKHDPAIEVRYKAGKQRSLMRFGSAMPSTHYSSDKGFEETPLVAPSVVLSGREKSHHPFVDVGVVESYIS